MKRGLIFLLVSLCAAAQTADEALAQRAVDAERRGNYPEAIKIFQQLIRGGVDSPDLRSNLGIAYYQSGAMQSALREFRKALSRAPNSQVANLFCGLSLLKLQEPREALRYLSIADRTQPNDVTTLSAIAEADIASSQVLPANGVYRRVTRLDPRNAEAWYGLGITDRLLAEAKLKAAKQMADPVQVQSLTRESQSLMSDFQDSVSLAMQLDPQSVRARMILGESFRIAERYDEALREYKLATEEAPTLAAAWAGLATAQSAAGDDEGALKTAQRALQLDPNDPATHVLVAAIYVRMGDVPKAEPFAQEALRLDPDLSSAHVVLARIYLANQQTRKALGELAAAAKDDVDGSTHYLLAKTLRQSGRSDEAASAMQEYERLHRLHVAPATQ